jgi:hypothetical protein
VRWWEGREIDPAAPLQTLLTQNFVTGCTIVVNRALLRAALPLPEVVMHDWWLALCAAVLGEILCCPGATVFYRQHDRNAAGTRWWLRAGLGAEREPGTAPPGGGSLAMVREYCGAFSPGATLAWPSCPALSRVPATERRGPVPARAVACLLAPMQDDAA